VELVLASHAVFEVLLVLLSVAAQQLLVFEFGVGLFGLLFVLVFAVPELAVLFDHLLVLPGPPNLILNLLLLFARLLYAKQNLLLSLFDLNQILVFVLVDDHLSAAFVALSAVDLLDFRVALDAEG
jgi:hypothetical protein